jgi:hypothetical protein
MRERHARADDAEQGLSGVDLTLIDEMLRLTPWERLQQNDRMAALAVELRDAFAAPDARWPNRDT